uniref:Uncharacterized protein n=1 Tax=Serratia marcescens TaxID=615 RepID=K7WLP8_SERMA|nr:Hypothetical protein [Serratia marcescens]
MKVERVVTIDNHEIRLTFNFVVNFIAGQIKQCQTVFINFFTVSSLEMCTFFIRSSVPRQRKVAAPPAIRGLTVLTKSPGNAPASTDSENIRYHDFHCALLGGRFIKCCANQVYGVEWLFLH